MTDRVQPSPEPFAPSGDEQVRDRIQDFALFEADRYERWAKHASGDRRADYLDLAAAFRRALASPAPASAPSEERVEIERLRVNMYRLRQSDTSSHTTACSIWGDNGQGTTREGWTGLPCNCGALINFHRKRAEEAEARIAALRGASPRPSEAGQASIKDADIRPPRMESGQASQGTSTVPNDAIAGAEHELHAILRELRRAPESAPPLSLTERAQAATTTKELNAIRHDYWSTPEAERGDRNASTGESERETLAKRIARRLADWYDDLEEIAPSTIERPSSKPSWTKSLPPHD